MGLDHPFGQSDLGLETKSTTNEEINEFLGYLLPYSFFSSFVVLIQMAETMIKALRTMVPTFDESSQTTRHKPITALLRNRCTRLVYITVGNETISSTMHHRFWAENKKQWVQAQYLEPGMFLRTVASQMREIQAIVVQEVPFHTSYNFSIADCHTYFVGREGFLPQGYAKRYRSQCRLGTNW